MAVNNGIIFLNRDIYILTRQLLALRNQLGQQLAVERRIDASRRRRITAIRHHGIVVAAAVPIVVPFDRSLTPNVLLAAVRRSAHRVAARSTKSARVAGRHDGAAVAPCGR